MVTNGTVGAVQSGSIKVPGYVAYGQFSGFTRTKDGDILLKDKVRTGKDGVQTTTQRVYVGFNLLGERAGDDAVLSIRWAGIKTITDQAGQQHVQFQDLSDSRLNLIKVIAASGLTVADLPNLRFVLPLTPQSILGEVERVLVEKAAGGHVLSLTIMEGDGESNWVNWDGGFVAMPPGTVVPGPAVPLQGGQPSRGNVSAEQKHISDYIRAVLDEAGDNAAALGATITQMAVDWGVNVTSGKTPVLDRLNTVQLTEVGSIMKALVQTAPELEPYVPPPADDIPF